MYLFNKKYSENCNIMKYYNFILLNYYIIITFNNFTFSVSLLQSSVSHDSSEIILIYDLLLKKNNILSLLKTGLF